MSLVIGITDTEARYENYPLWIKENDDSIEIIRLTPANKELLNACDGIVLSGGVDTHPSFYNNQRLNYPLAPTEFNTTRDKFEISVFEYTQKNKVPVLAICRGMQLINIALGGDMIQDIEEAGKQNHRRVENRDTIHAITINKETQLYKITGTEQGIINSAHHQALGKVAERLIITGYSPDGIAESAELKQFQDYAFLLCVQWHPERLAQEQPENPFAKNIRTAFLQAAINFKQQK
ncbi:MAG: gamma-glutamyl-gamma-aminobutyrate hydrolase family protein [Bacteroidia bacterium]